MFKNKMRLTVGLLATAAIAIAACTNQNKENITPDTSGNGCDTANITYSNYVKSVMDVSCATAGCHDATNSGNVRLDSYQGAKDAALNTATQNTSLLLGAINHQSGFDAMPQNGAKLSDCTIDKITAWVNNGAPQ